ncbi:MAG: hypothetical protein OSB70_02925 [Myxococcota bacterium]|nr:hypothetical protein [Myxococcota bacterium]
MELWRAVDKPAAVASRGKSGAGRGWISGPLFALPLALPFSVLLLSLWACGSAQGPAGPPSIVPPSSEFESPEGAFSGQAARRDLESLLGLGARGPGSPSAVQAASWLEEKLSGLGAQVERWSAKPPAEASPGSVGAVVGVLRGESPDPILLLARYDTLPGERDGGGPRAAAAAAAPALVLELGRVLAASPKPYTVWLVFIAGDGAADVAPDAPNELARRFPGSAAVAGELEARGALERSRLAIFVGPLPGPSSTIQRDLRSHRFSREVLWQSAESLEATAIFPGRAGYDSPESGHLLLLERGLRSTVGLAGAADPVGVPSAAFLTQLGRVTIEAIGRIEGRLQRIDAFSKGPVGEAWAPEPPLAWPTAAPLAPDGSSTPLWPSGPQ